MVPTGSTVAAVGCSTRPAAGDAEARAAYQAARGEAEAARLKTIVALRSAHAADREYFRVVDTVVCPPPDS